MKDHAEFAEDLALYALGALDARESPELEAHLRTCDECRRELEALRADLALVALSTTGPQPPQRSRQRLMNALAGQRRLSQRHPGPQVVSVRQRPRWFAMLPITAALALAALCIGLMIQVYRLRVDNAKLAQDLALEKQRYTAAKAVMDMLNDPSVQRMTLVSAQARPEPQIKTFYKKTEGRVLLLANNLQALPADKRYQLWLIPADGSAPMPAGLLRVEPDGSAMMMHSMDTPGVEAKAFAVTIEPLHGSRTPTMPLVMAPAS